MCGYSHNFIHNFIVGVTEPNTWCTGYSHNLIVRVIPHHVYSYSVFLISYSIFCGLIIVRVTPHHVCGYSFFYTLFKFLWINTLNPKFEILIVRVSPHHVCDYNFFYTLSNFLWINTVNLNPYF